MYYKLKYINNNGDEFEWSLESNNIITKQSGLTGIDISVKISQSHGQIGESITNQSIKSKSIFLEGILKRVDDKLKLLNIIRPLSSGKLIFNNIYEIEVMVKSTPEVDNQISNSNFQVSFIAPYPYWSKIKENSLNLHGLYNNFKFPYNHREAWTFGKRIDLKYTTIINESNIPAEFIIDYFASATVINPKISLYGTDNYIKLEYQLSKDEHVRIVASYGNLSVRSYTNDKEVDLISRWAYKENNLFKLNPGINYLQVSSDVGINALNAKIIFKEAWIGVTTNATTF